MNSLAENDFPERGSAEFLQARSTRRVTRDIVVARPFSQEHPERSFTTAQTRTRITAVESPTMRTDKSRRTRERRSTRY